MRDSSSFLDSPLSPLWHLFASPFLLPTRSPSAYSFAELVPSPFPRPRISLANRYFSAAFLPVYTYVYMMCLPRARTMPCRYSAISCARKNVVSDVLFNRTWGHGKMLGKSSILDFGNFSKSSKYKSNLKKYDIKM